MEKRIFLDERNKVFGELDSPISTVTTDCDEGETLSGAAINNDCHTAKKLLQSEYDKHSKDELCNEAIHLASMDGNAEIIKRLLKSHANKNARGENGMTPVILAAQYNHLDIVEILIEAGCDIHSKDDDGDEAIHLAAMEGNAEIVKLLLKSHANKNATGENGMTPLILAAKNNHLETAKILIEAGCDIHTKDDDGDEAIHLAAMEGKAEIVKLLLESHANKNATGEDGTTPVIFAAQNNHLETVKILIEAGCDIHSDQAIYLAGVNGHVEMVKFLQDYNADMNARGEEERTPPIFAARNNHSTLGKMLVEAGCDANSKDAQGQQAYHYAADLGSKESVAILRKSRNMDDLLDSDRSNEETWNFEIENEEMYLTNGNMSSMMELYIPKGTLPSASSSVVKATIRQKCNQNPVTQDQEGQFGPTISLLPHGTKFARPILALIRLPYDDLLNAEEFEFLVLHSDTEDDAPEEWVDITEFEEGETSGLVVPEHNVSMVVLFHFSFLTWFRRRRRKTLQVLMIPFLKGEILTVKCRFYPADDNNDKGVNADCKGTDIFCPPLVITSEDSPINVYIERSSAAWKLLSLQKQQINHDLVWRTKDFLELQFKFEMGDNSSQFEFVCTVVAQQKMEPSSCTVILECDLLGSRSKKTSSSIKLDQDMEKPTLDSCSKHTACGSSHYDSEEPTAAGCESTTDMSLPRDYRSYYREEENSRFCAYLNRPIPETIRQTVTHNRVELMKCFTLGAELLNHLKSKGVFTTEQIDKIKIKDGLITEQADMVLDMLPKISFYHYLMFRECLIATNQRHVCRYLPKHDGSASGQTVQ